MIDGATIAYHFIEGVNKSPRAGVSYSQTRLVLKLIQSAVRPNSNGAMAPNLVKRI